MSIQIIILVVIGLIVLVVLIAIFTSKSGDASNILESCEARGGTCQPKTDPCRDGKIMPGVECEGKDYVCCYKLKE